MIFLPRHRPVTFSLAFFYFQNYCNNSTVFCFPAGYLKRYLIPGPARHLKEGNGRQRSGIEQSQRCSVHQLFVNAITLLIDGQRQIRRCLTGLQTGRPFAARYYHRYYHETFRCVLVVGSLACHPLRNKKCRRQTKFIRFCPSAGCRQRIFAQNQRQPIRRLDLGKIGFRPFGTRFVF